MIKKYSIFGISNHVFALAVDAVKEVLPFQTLSKLPNVPRYFMGIFNWRGFIINVIDIREIFGLEPDMDYEKQLIVVFETEDIRFGFFTNQVYNVMNIDDYRKLDTDMSFRDYVSGVIKNELYDSIYLLNPEKLKYCGIL